MDIRRLQTGDVLLKATSPIMPWVEASFCPRSLCGRDDRGLDCRDTCVLLPCKTKRWNKAKTNHHKTAAMTTMRVHRDALSETYMAETPAPIQARNYTREQTRQCPLAKCLSFSFVRWKKDNHTHTATTNTNGSWLLLQLMRLSLSRDGSLPQLF